VAFAAERIAWRAQYQAAKALAEGGASDIPATTPAANAA
jgi:hypothetical protein